MSDVIGDVGRDQALAVVSCDVTHRLDGVDELADDRHHAQPHGHRVEGRADTLQLTGGRLEHRLDELVDEDIRREVRLDHLPGEQSHEKAAAVATLEQRAEEGVGEALDEVLQGIFDNRLAGHFEQGRASSLIQRRQLGAALRRADGVLGALERRDGPTSLVFSRQGLPHQDRDEQQLAAIARGAYILRDSAGAPDAIIIATGSEVHLATAAAETVTPVPGSAGTSRSPTPSRSGGRAVVAGIMQHIEEAGIHSGDSACVIPPYSLDAAMQAEIERAAISLAKELEVRGLMNIQFAVKEEDGRMNVYVLEVNPRASRTVPFVAKATGVPVAKIAALGKLMAAAREAVAAGEESPADRRQRRAQRRAGARRAEKLVSGRSRGFGHGTGATAGRPA